MTGHTADSELDRWNGRFANEEFLFGTRPNAFLAAQGWRLSAGMRALCIADGEGRNSVWLRRNALADLTSIEQSIMLSDHSVIGDDADPIRKKPGTD